MELFWQIFFWLIPIWTFVLIPFSSFYYEADDGAEMASLVGVSAPSRSRSRIVQALCSLMVVMVVASLVFLLTYLFLSDTSVPVTEYVGSTLVQARLAGVVSTMERNPDNNGTFATWQLEDVGETDAEFAATFPGETDEPVTLTLRVDLPTFYAGLMAWIGWFFFAVFGGIGISALPLDLILAFRNRPKHMNPEEFAEAKMSIQQRVNEMVEIGEELKREREEQDKLGNTAQKRSLFNAQHRREAKAERNTMREFKASTFLLEQDVEDFVAASSAHEKYNPLVPWLSLFFGIICAIISLLWVVHIAIYVLPPEPLHPFLNSYFQVFDSFFPLFGTLSVAIFTVYLLFAAVKGCFKFGLRFLCIA